MNNLGTLTALLRQRHRQRVYPSASTTCQVFQTERYASTEKSASVYCGAILGPFPYPSTLTMRKVFAAGRRATDFLAHSRMECPESQWHIPLSCSVPIGS